MINDEDRDDDREDDTTGEDTATQTDPNDLFAGLSDEEIEARARKQGYRSEADWDDARAEREGRRKPTKFLTPREYLERIDKELPMMRDRYRRSEQTNAKLEREIGEVKKQLTEVGQLLKTQHDMSIAAKKKAYEKGIADERARQRQAVEDGDTKAYDKAQETIDALEDEKKELDRAPETNKDDKGNDDKREERREPEIDDETKTWVDSNKKWFLSDAVLNAYTIDMNGQVRREHPDWSITEQLDEAKKRTMEKFPEKFGKNPNRSGNGAVSPPSGGERGARDSVSKRFDALPAEAKANYEKYKKQFKTSHNVDYTKEEYLADYHD